MGTSIVYLNRCSSLLSPWIEIAFCCDITAECIKSCLVFRDVSLMSDIGWRQNFLVKSGIIIASVTLRPVETWDYCYIYIVQTCKLYSFNILGSNMC